MGRKILKKDIQRKADKLKKLFPNLFIYIDGRRRAVYINNIHFTFQEFWQLDLEKLKHPSFWGV